MAAMKASHGRMEALMYVIQEATEAYPEMEGKEPTSEEVKSEAVHVEVPKKEAAVKSFGALKKRHGDRHLAVGRREKPRDRTQGKGGSRKKLAVARKGMTCR
jgi:hypothetical protein